MIENEKLVTLVRPVLGQLGTQYAGPKAEAMLLAIGLQESNFVHRDQLSADGTPGAIGPATGFWQFEKNGGTAGVLNHAATATLARELCDSYQLKSLPTAPWEFFATEEGDELACAFARLLLWTDAKPLSEPTVEHWTVAFDYYLRNWRPGAWFNSAEGSPKRQELAARFRTNWLRAIAAVGGSGALQAERPVDLPPTTKSLILTKIEELRKLVEDAL